MLRLYFEVLTENQKRGLKDLKAFSKYGVLASGIVLLFWRY
jgi:hypothetical protein